MPPTDTQMIKAAQAAVISKEGTLEVDDGAVVSRAEDNCDHGAYVAAWLWVDDGDVEE